ncbi:MAG: hypothetical protein MZU95_17200 [Desulfomicrobium escambiense]|nr:hypothetical protein [Desulfomicrobium escambiense]
MLVLAAHGDGAGGDPGRHPGAGRLPAAARIAAPLGGGLGAGRLHLPAERRHADLRRPLPGLSRGHPARRPPSTSSACTCRMMRIAGRAGVGRCMMAALYLFIQKTKIGHGHPGGRHRPGRGAAHGHRRQPGDPAGLPASARPWAARPGCMVGLYYGQINFTMGWTYGMKAFTAAILGGIGNIPGAMVGGLLLGVIEALGAAYISIAWKDAIAFCVLILILIVRPTGLLGERVAEKV